MGSMYGGVLLIDLIIHFFIHSKTCWSLKWRKTCFDTFIIVLLDNNNIINNQNNIRYWSCDALSLSLSCGMNKNNHESRAFFTPLLRGSSMELCRQYESIQQWISMPSLHFTSFLFSSIRSSWVSGLLYRSNNWAWSWTFHRWLSGDKSSPMPSPLRRTKISHRRNTIRSSMSLWT